MLRIFFLFLIATSLQINIGAQDYLVAYELKGSSSLANLQTTLNPLAENRVEYYKVTYKTEDVLGQLDTASGLVVIPVRELNTEFPLLASQHGTTSGAQEVPSNLSGGYELALVWGSMGYITAAPDYLGMGESRGFHPYLHADSEASAAIDMLHATRELADVLNVKFNDQLFISGYSQGGHAAAALQREIEANHTDDFTVTASAPMSGPYNLSGSMLDLMFGDEPYNSLGYIPYVVLSYDYAYDLYEGNMEAVFRPEVVDAVQQFRDGEIDLFYLNTLLVTIVTGLDGSPKPRYLLQDSVRLGLQTNPDHPLRKKLEENDVYDWVPTAPTRFFYCEADDQVPYENSIFVDSLMNARGAEDVAAISVGETLNHTECVVPAMIASMAFFGQYRTITDVENIAWDDAYRARIFPQPAHSRLEVENIPQDAELRLYDSQGRMLQSWTTRYGHMSLPVSQWSAGFYVLEISSEYGRQLERVIIAR